MSITILSSYPKLIQDYTFIQDYLIGIANIWRYGIVAITLCRLPWKEPEIDCLINGLIFHLIHLRNIILHALKKTFNKRLLSDKPIHKNETLALTIKH